MDGETNRSGKGLLYMDGYTLLEQAKRFLDGDLTFRQLDERVSENVLHDFRFGDSDPHTTKVTYNLVGIFSEYDLDCELLGRPEAMKAFRKGLLEFVRESSDSAPTDIAVEHAPR